MTPEDLDFLLTDAGGALLEAAAGLDFSRASSVASTAALRRVDPVHAAAAIDVVAARARAAGRLRGAQTMLLTGEAVQQATAWPVAALRAHNHMAVLLVSHDLDVVRRYADHVVLMQGTVLRQGRPKEVFESPEFGQVFYARGN